MKENKKKYYFLMKMKPKDPLKKLVDFTYMTHNGTDGHVKSTLNSILVIKIRLSVEL